VTRVVLADDQELVRTGFKLLINMQPDLQVVGEAADGREAIAVVPAEQPDIVLMDIRMPVLDGLEATRRLISSGAPCRVLILTTFDLDEYVYDAMRAGASGFLLKDVGHELFLAGIRTVAAGDALVAPSVTRRLIEQFVNRPPPGTHHPSDAPSPRAVDGRTPEAVQTRPTVSTVDSAPDHASETARQAHAGADSAASCDPQDRSPQDFS
jgi:DNA-binding NarL/FixJ family response regulator